MGGTEGGNNPTPSPSFRGAGAEVVAMVTIAPWSGDFLSFLSSLCSSPSSSNSSSNQVFSLSFLMRGRG